MTTPTPMIYAPVYCKYKFTPRAIKPATVWPRVFVWTRARHWGERSAMDRSLVVGVRHLCREHLDLGATFVSVPATTDRP